MVGRLGRPHGLDGYLGIYVEEEDTVVLQTGATVLLEERPYRVRAIRKVDRRFQIAFEGVLDREHADELRGLDVVVTQRRLLGEGEYWPEDLVGISVFRQGGEQVGVVVEVVSGPGQDRLVVGRQDGGRFEVPFVDELVPVVDIEQRRIEIDPIPGLIEPSD